MFQFRMFAAPGKGQAVAATPNKDIYKWQSPIQQLIDKGTEMIMGPPPGHHKVYQAHRDTYTHKLDERFVMQARKLRETYLREGTFPLQKSYIDVVRDRQPEDTLEKLMEEKLIPAVIQGREEFEDVDLVMKQSSAFYMMHSQHPEVKSFYLKHKGEETRVTVLEIEKHFRRFYPISAILQRYIVGRPNLLKMPLYLVNEDRSPHFQAGTVTLSIINELYVWSFIDQYPPRIEVDCSYLSPKLPICIGDVEKLLPYGMYLHKKYDKQKYMSVVKHLTSQTYNLGRSAKLEQDVAIYEQRQSIKTAMTLPDQQQKSGPKPVIKPYRKFTAKDLLAEKKENEKRRAKEGKEGKEGADANKGKEGKVAK